MVNRDKTLKRERTRLRNLQNPEQIDYKIMGRKRSAKTEYWKMKKRAVVPEKKADTKGKIEKKAKPEKEKKVKEPELEVIDEEPVIGEVLEEVEEIDDELEELYSYDDEDLDEDFEENEDASD
ncbi:MAG: hypothetical protein JW779_12550 [Candidatus Thorarchaeota archaeon]|nr:hypothetical protein [Candidatus Thorarchaeota archaeon]